MKQNLALAAAIGIAFSFPQLSFAADDTHLLGDWNGQRTRLVDEGVTFNFGYGSQIAHNTSGGSDNLTRYSDQWLFGTELDLQKLWGWQGAKLNVAITDRNGKNLSDDAHLGTFQQVQEVYGRGQTWRLTNFFLAQSLMDGRLLLKAGRMGIGADFAAFTCEFQNLTFCGAQPGNLVGGYWANWPVSVWAGVARLNTSKETYVQLGAYQVNPHYVDDSYNVHRGLVPNFPDGTTGALIPLEFGYTPASVGAFHGLPGSYKVGVWYNTSDSADLMFDQNRQPLGTTSVGALQRDGAYGGYINFQQQVSGVANGEGATVFLNVTQADKFTAATDAQVALGVQYKGAFQRPADVIGVALGTTHGNGRRGYAQRAVNSTIVNDGYEVAAEVYYGWSPLPSVVIRPNLQFIKHPGGTSQNDDAVVLGLKTSLSF
ncbi:MAG: carbohydrate porin [Pseudomonadota bacterium]|nr:carbohydrate porin [Pseudomonadota bacterium]